VEGQVADNQVKRPLLERQGRSAGFLEYVAVGHPGDPGILLADLLRVIPIFAPEIGAGHALLAIHLFLVAL